MRCFDSPSPPPITVREYVQRLWRYMNCGPAAVRACGFREDGPKRQGNIGLFLNRANKVQVRGFRVGCRNLGPVAMGWPCAIFKAVVCFIACTSVLRRVLMLWLSGKSFTGGRGREARDQLRQHRVLHHRADLHRSTACARPQGTALSSFPPRGSYKAVVRADVGRFQ